MIKVIHVDEIKALAIATQFLAGKNVECASDLIRREIPFAPVKNAGRHYSIAQKLAIFARDHFIDRYSGKMLLNPGALRSISRLCPREFLFQTNWRMDICHPAIWRLMPTIDHVVPVSRGGSDEPANWVTTNMLHNSAKANWTLEELGRKLYPLKDGRGWDGLSRQFLTIFDQYPLLHEDAYIRDWYRATSKIYG